MEGKAERGKNKKSNERPGGYGRKEEKIRIFFKKKIHLSYRCVHYHAVKAHTRFCLNRDNKIP